jgi:hypothetical protein
LWRSGLESGRSETQSLSNLPPKTVRTVLFQGGEGKNLKAGHAYDIEVQVQGSLIAGLIDGVEVMRYSVDSDVIGGQQFGILCGSLGRIDISNIVVKSERPKAFIVMQFNTPEYEALYKDVLQPVCEREGLIPYRGDSTYLPGLVIADIKKQIAESRIIIAEISPANANVYYEIGYADALNKPLILIANKNEGLKPFDVRAYRTIFYENSIGGKNKVESDLQSYLRSILAQ